MGDIATQDDKLTPLQSRACELAASGMSTEKVCEALGISTRTLWAQRSRVPAFDRDYASARKLAAECLGDKLLTLVDEYDDVQAARLQSDNVKWWLARTHREVFGDRVDVNVAVTVDVGQALQDARARALAVRPMCDLEQIEDAEYTVPSIGCDSGAGDKQSVSGTGDQDLPDIFK